MSELGDQLYGVPQETDMSKPPLGTVPPVTPMIAVNPGTVANAAGVSSEVVSILLDSDAEDSKVSNEDPPSAGPPELTDKLPKTQAITPHQDWKAWSLAWQVHPLPR